MTHIVVSSPGKIHLLGEHTVVYGKPALIAAIDKRCTVKLFSRSDKKVEIISNNFNRSDVMTIDDVLEITNAARKKWNKFVETKDMTYLFSITKKPLDYLFLAVGQSFLDMDSSFTSGFTIELNSSIPVGSGCGSSSAIAVSIAGAIQIHLEQTLDKKKLLNTALRIEEFKHGTPSGGDPATVVHGGFVLFEKKGITPLNIPLSEELSKNALLIDTGKPKESTGEMIGLVREHMKRNSQKVQKIVDNQESLTYELLDALKTGGSGLVLQSMKAGERNLENLGVVSPFVKTLIGEIESVGAAAKISGGGGKTKGTGMLLVYTSDKDAVKRIAQSHGLSCFDTILGGEGLRKDE